MRIMNHKFLPTSPEEMRSLGWDAIDVLLISGDAYVDHPSFGIAIIARVLEAQGYRVAVVWQPDVTVLEPMKEYGTPRIMIGISSGNVDSMIANYTPSRKPRHKDDYTPDQRGIRRPDRAVIRYAQWARSIFSGVPIVIGGIEASLRRLAHYDWWQDRVRHSILLDSKAHYLLYGMAEESVVQLANCLATASPPEKTRSIRGLVYSTSSKEDLPANSVMLPPYEQVCQDRLAFVRAFQGFYHNQDPQTARPLVQQDGNRYVIQTPPSLPPSTQSLDKIYALPFTRQIHPSVIPFGRVKAWETVRFSITTHRGCYGQCHFCAISAHQGTAISSRSEESILGEVSQITQDPSFRGFISDVGGPTANMYQLDCLQRKGAGTCTDRSCLIPEPCPALFRAGHRPYLQLLRNIRSQKGIKAVFIASGIRPELIGSDTRYGKDFLLELFRFHTSGQLKLAPEHADDEVLNAMGKSPIQSFLDFDRHWRALVTSTGKRQYVIGYFMCGHPGETEDKHRSLVRFVREKLGYAPQQIQIFTPIPSTVSATMYHTQLDPRTERPIFAEKRERVRNRWKHEILHAREVWWDGNDASNSKRSSSNGVVTRKDSHSRKIGAS